ARGLGGRGAQGPRLWRLSDGGGERSRRNRGNPACFLRRRLGRRHVLRPSGIAASRGGPRAGTAAVAVVARPRAVFRMGDRRDRAAAAERLCDGVRRLWRLRRARALCSVDDGDRHLHDALVLSPLLRAVAAVPSGGGGPTFWCRGAAGFIEPRNSCGPPPPSPSFSPRLVLAAAFGRCVGGTRRGLG